MVDIQSATAEIRRGEEKRKKGRPVNCFDCKISDDNEYDYKDMIDDR